MNIEYELGYYLDTKESNGAFLICGSRGSGKSHIVRQYIADKKNCESSFFVMLSLFGISSVESLTKAIKENIAYRAIIPSRLSKSNQKANLSDTHAGRLIQFIGSEKLSDFKIPVSVSLLDLVQIQSTVRFPTGDKRLVLIFDDLDRSSLTLPALSGYIYSLTEGLHVKTVLLADESAMPAGEFAAFRERIVGHTCHVNPDYKEAAAAIVRTYHAMDPSYSAFLKKHTDDLILAFEGSRSRSLRPIRKTLIGFERVYYALSSITFTPGFWGDLFYNFSLASIRAGMDGQREADAPEEESARENNLLPCLRRWIEEGDWDEETVKESYRSRYEARAASVDRQLLHLGFWSLDDAVVREGLPVLLEQAYRGELPCNDAVLLLERLCELEANGIPLPCPVDYAAWTAGMRGRLSAVCQGRADESPLHAEAEDGKLDAMGEEARALYRYICDTCDESIRIRKSRKASLECLRRRDINKLELMRRDPVGPFDEEMQKAFCDCYMASGNETRRRMARCLAEAPLPQERAMDTEGRSESVRNLRRLGETLRETQRAAKTPLRGSSPAKPPRRPRRSPPGWRTEIPRYNKKAAPFGAASLFG